MQKWNNKDKTGIINKQICDISIYIHIYSLDMCVIISLGMGQSAERTIKSCVLSKQIIQSFKAQTDYNIRKKS